MKTKKRCKRCNRVISKYSLNLYGDYCCKSCMGHKKIKDENIKFKTNVNDNTEETSQNLSNNLFSSDFYQQNKNKSNDKKNNAESLSSTILIENFKENSLSQKNISTNDVIDMILGK